MVRPNRECSSKSVGALVSIVDRLEIRPCMAKSQLSCVHIDAEPRQAGSKGSAQIVQRELDAGGLRQAGDQLRPAAHRSAGSNGWEDEIRPSVPMTYVQDLLKLRRDRDLMATA